MTRVYFVRHAQPEHEWEEDRTRPLTETSIVIQDSIPAILDKCKS